MILKNHDKVLSIDKKPLSHLGDFGGGGGGVCVGGGGEVECWVDPLKKQNLWRKSFSQIMLNEVLKYMLMWCKS